MKIRYGFVTNSSSSSFILAFKNRSEIEDLNVSERVMETLLDEENLKTVDEVLDEYREYIEEMYECELTFDIAKEIGIKSFDVYEWSKEHPEEYQKFYDEMYKEKCENKVKALEKKLKGKELLYVIYEGDEWDSYFEYQKMKQLCGLMDYH